MISFLPKAHVKKTKTTRDLKRLLSWSIGPTKKKNRENALLSFAFSRGVLRALFLGPRPECLAQVALPASFPQSLRSRLRPRLEQL